MQGARIQSLVGELDPACMPQLGVHMPQLKISHMPQRRPGAAKIKKLFKTMDTAIFPALHALPEPCTLFGSGEDFVTASVNGMQQKRCSMTSGV